MPVHALQKDRERKEEPMRHKFHELVFFRHGESLANVASIRAQKGDFSVIERLRNTPSREVPLTRRGVATSRALGEMHSVFSDADAFFVSEYVRAKETAHHSNFTQAWKVDRRLNERDWGMIDHVTPQEREALAPEWKRAKERSPYRWRPLNGETLMEKKFAIANFLDELSSHGAARIVVVSHGEAIQAARTELEHIPEHIFAERERDMRMDNCDGVHYRYSERSLWMRMLPFGGTPTKWELVR